MFGVKVWIKKFETGDFDLSDKPGCRRLSFINVVKIMLEGDPFQTSESAERLNSAQQTILDDIRETFLFFALFQKETELSGRPDI